MDVTSVICSVQGFYACITLSGYVFGRLLLSHDETAHTQQLTVSERASSSRLVNANYWNSITIRVINTIVVEKPVGPYLKSCYAHRCATHPILEIS